MSLPISWTETSISDLIPEDGVFIDGDWIESKDQDPDGDVRLIQLADIKEFAFVSKSDRYLTKKKAGELGCTFLKQDDVLVARMPDPIGRACIFPYSEENCFVTVVDVAIIRTNSKIVLPKFLMYAINTPNFRNRVIENAGGSTRQRISRKNLGILEIPLAPLPEQKRIVAKLDTLFAHLDQLKARLEKIPGLLKQFRQAVLTQAVTGKLTEEWRSDKKTDDASVVFTKIQEHLDHYHKRIAEEAQQNGRRKPKDHRTNKKSIPYDALSAKLPESWNFYRLEDITYLVTDGTHKTPKYQSEGVKFLSVKNVRPFKIKDSDIKFISQEEYNEINSRCNPEKGDILYTKVGATFGYACINNLEYPFSIFVSLALIKPIKEFTISKYLELVMNSELIFEQARERVTGIGTPDLHLIEIRDFKIPLCSVDEQKEIVRRVESLFAVADRIEASYKTLQEKIDQLPQAILSKAFRGELVEQEEMQLLAAEAKVLYKKASELI